MFAVTLLSGLLSGKTVPNRTAAGWMRGHNAVSGGCHGVYNMAVLQPDSPTAGRYRTALADVAGDYG